MRLPPIPIRANLPNRTNMKIICLVASVILLSSCTCNRMVGQISLNSKPCGPTCGLFATSTFYRNGKVNGSHVSGSPEAKFEHIEEGQLSHGTTTKIFSLAEKIAFSPTGVKSEAPVGNSYYELRIEFCDEQKGCGTFYATLPFSEDSPDPDLRALFKLLTENRTGGW